MSRGSATTVAPLFESAPRFIERLAAARPFEDEDDLFVTARATARSMPEDEQIELLNAHPPIGADAGAMSAMSRAEQGPDEPDANAWVADELAALNAAYEGLFGFRYVVFVAGRPRSDIIPLIERAVHADRDEELRRGLDDVVFIAEDRWRTLRGPAALREELREAIALEVSRWMVGELDREGLGRAAHRLIEEGVTSQALVALSIHALAAGDGLEAAVARLMARDRPRRLGRRPGGSAAGTPCRGLDPRGGQPAHRRGPAHRCRLRQPRVRYAGQPMGVGARSAADPRRGDPIRGSRPLRAA